MTVSLHQQAFAGFSNTKTDNGLARGAAVGIFRKALSNIEPLVTQLPNIDSSGSSFKLRNGCPSNTPLRTRSRHQADHTHGQLAGLLTRLGFQLGAARAAPVFRRNSGG